MKIIFFFLLILGFFTLNSMAMDSDLMAEKPVKRSMIGCHEIDDFTEIHFSNEPTSAEDLTALNPHANKVKEF